MLGRWHIPAVAQASSSRLPGVSLPLPQRNPEDSLTATGTTPAEDADTRCQSRGTGRGRRGGRVQRQRRCIIQPRVARNELPWVIDRKMETTLKGLHRTMVPVMQPFQGWVECLMRIPRVGIVVWKCFSAWSLSCTLNAMLRSGPKALHKPAQGKRGTSAALGLVAKRNNALKGLRMVSRPFRALFIFLIDPRAASASDAALPWAGL